MVGQHCLGSSFLCPFLLQSARAGHRSMEDKGKLPHPQSRPGAPEPLTSSARSRWYGGSLGCLQTVCWLLLLLCRAWWDSPSEAWVPRCCLGPTMSKATHRYLSSSPWMFPQANPPVHSACSQNAAPIPSLRMDGSL